MRNKKITDEQLYETVKNAKSVSDALRKLGVTPNGSTHTYYSKRIKNIGISTDHFKNDRNLYGIKKDKLKPEDIFVKKIEGSTRTKRKYLLRAMLEIGHKYECSICFNNGEWMNNELVLQIDHIDGDRLNNTSTNLRFLCPNCHSQTDTFSNKKPRSKCRSCDTMIQKQNITGMCRSCNNKNNPRKTKIEWPSREELIEMLKNSSYTHVGKTLGVSDNAVRKHINK